MLEVINISFSSSVWFVAVLFCSKIGAGKHYLRSIHTFGAEKNFQTRLHQKNLLRNSPKKLMTFFAFQKIFRLFASVYYAFCIFYSNFPLHSLDSLLIYIKNNFFHTFRRCRYAINFFVDTLQTFFFSSGKKVPVRRTDAYRHKKPWFVGLECGFLISVYGDHQLRLVRWRVSILDHSTGIYITTTPRSSLIGTPTQAIN